MWFVVAIAAVSVGGVCGGDVVDRCGGVLFDTVVRIAMHVVDGIVVFT